MTDSAAGRTVDQQEIRRLLHAREARQTDLARALGVRDSAVSDLLRGKRGIRDRELPVFAAFLGIEIEAALRLLGVIPRSNGFLALVDADGSEVPEEDPAKTVLYAEPSPDLGDPCQPRPQLSGAAQSGIAPTLPQERLAVLRTRRDRPSALLSSNRGDRG